MITKLKKKIAYGRQIRKLKRLYSTMNSVGSNVYICPGYHIACPSNITIESDVWIGWNSYISADGGLTIKKGTITSRNLEIWTSNHNYDSDGMETIPYDRNFVRKPVVIGENVWIGSSVIILPGITIGEGAVIGAGSVVAKDIPPFAVVGGNPAKVLKYRDIERYNKLKSQDKIYLKEYYNYDVSLDITV